MQRKNRKIVIIFLILVVIYGLIIVIINRNRKLEKDETITIFIDQNTIVKYENNILTKVEKYNEDIEYVVYFNHNYAGIFKIKNRNLYQNNQLVINEDNYFAYPQNLHLNIKRIFLEKIDTNDLIRINRIIGRNINVDDLLVNEKVITDLDNNGISDTIVNVSNLKYGIKADIYFNLVYLILNNEEKILIKEIVSPKDVLVKPSYYINNIFSIDNNFNYLVIQKLYFSMGGEPSCMVYEYQNGEYIKIID